MTDTVLATVTRFLVDAAVALGRRRDAVLSRAGLDDPSLSLDGARVPFRSHMAVWQAVVEAAGDRDIGIELGRTVHVGMLGVVGYALGQAPTLRDALPFYRRCAPLVSDLFMPRLEERGGRLVIEQIGPPELVRLRHPDELGLAAALTIVRTLTEARWPILAVRFQHAAPPSTAGVSAFFGRGIEFGASSTRLELDGAALSAPIRKADPRLFEYLTRHAESLLAQVAGAQSFAERVRRAILPLLRDGEPPQDRIARQLGVSGRTLQRRLKQEGTGFAEVVEGARRELALLYLDEPRLSVTEVAFLLGYAEPSAFSRAFRRWTGATPRGHRARPTAARISRRDGGGAVQ